MLSLSAIAAAILLTGSFLNKRKQAYNTGPKKNGASKNNNLDNM
jgi:hypothetical protein